MKNLSSIYTVTLFCFAIAASSCAVNTGAGNESVYYGSSPELITEKPLQCRCCSTHLGSAKLPKRVAVTAFTINSNVTSIDLPNFEQYFSKEMLSRLAASDYFQVRNASHIAIKERAITPSGHESITVAEQIRQIASQFDSQIVVGGSITDTRLRPGEGFLDSDKRHFTVHYKVYDGFSGLELFNQSNSVQIQAGELNQIIPPVGPAFYRTQTGQAVDLLLQTQVQQTRNTTSCIPLMSRLHIRSNNEVALALGVESGVAPGDTFALVHGISFHVDDTGMNQFEYKPVATFRVTSVQPTLIFGVIENKTDAYQLNKNDYAVGW